MAGSGLRRPTLLDSTTTSNRSITSAMIPSNAPDRSASSAGPKLLVSPAVLSRSWQRRRASTIEGRISPTRRSSTARPSISWPAARGSASNGLLKTSPPKSKMTARTGMTEMRSARQQVAGDRLPQGGRQAQRLDVHALVVAVEHPAVVLEGQLLAEQAEPVGGGAQPAEEAGVGRPDADHGHQVAVGVEDPRGAGQGVPQRCLHR